MPETDKSKTFETPGQHVYDGIVYPGLNKPLGLDRVKSFDFRDKDVLVTSFPKSGTSWLLEIMYLIVNNADTDKAKELDLIQRCPYLETKLGSAEGAQYIKNMSGTRVMFSHLPSYFIEEKMRTVNMKVVYVIRNPKDTLVSFYHFYKMMNGFGHYSGSWDSFFNMYKAGKVMCGDWFDHVNGFWQQRHLPNLKIVKYEDMKKDLQKWVRHLADFVGITLTAEQVHTIAEYCSFDQMSKRPVMQKQIYAADRGKFMRKGEIGDWKNFFDNEQNQFMNSNYGPKLEDVGLDVEY